MVYQLGSRVQKIRRMRPRHSLLIVGLAVAVFVTSVTSAAVWKSPQINNWWPVADAKLSGTQPVKADLVGYNVTDYKMYWSADEGGSRNLMSNDYTDYPHKESSVDFSNWTWKGSGPYTLTFIAVNNSNVELARKTINIYVNQVTGSTGQNSAALGDVLNSNLTDNVVPAPAAQTAPLPTVTLPAAVATLLYAPASNSARQQAAAWRTSRPADAQVMDRLGSTPQSTWFGDWNRNIEGDVHAVVAAAQAAGSTPVLVAYNIPQRDCGGYSAGGSSSQSAYSTWVSSFARGIGNGPAIVVLEPDALSSLDCLNQTDRTRRFQMISEAITTLKQQSGTRVYIDAGNPRWTSASDMAPRLTSANIARADGFSLNVSNFFTNDENIRFGSDLSGKVQGKHFVIDTSRNGAGPTPDAQWCNPAGRAVGSVPTTATGQPLVDAYLWIKTPGESDGSCNGAPGAGTWMPEYALGLARKAGW